MDIELLINLSRNLKKQIQEQNDTIDTFFKKEKEGTCELLSYVYQLYKEIDVDTCELTKLDINNIYTLCRLFCCKESINQRPAILLRNRLAKKMISDLKQGKMGLKEMLQKLYF